MRKPIQPPRVPDFDTDTCIECRDEVEPLTDANPAETDYRWPIFESQSTGRYVSGL